MTNRNHAAMSDPGLNPQFRRRWTEPPQCEGSQSLGQVAAKITNDLAHRAVRHWLKQADQLEGEERIICLETADAILRTAGLRWGDVLPRRAA